MEKNILYEIYEKRKTDLNLMELYLGRLHPNQNRRRKTIKETIVEKNAIPNNNIPFLITELKPKSPSKGILIQSSLINPISIAREMEYAGSSALSVLTEPHYFGGSFELLKECCKNTKLPVLMKDFIFSPIQIRIAKNLGASNILLISGYSNLELLLSECKNLGIEPLIEIHSKEDIEELIRYKDIIKEIGLIGINNRDLKTLSIDLATTKTLYPILRNKFGGDVPIISESGFQSYSEIKEFMELGISGFLIGTSIMQSESIGKKIKSLMGVQ